MKLVYIVDFSVEGSSGKHKATREKALALKKLLGEKNVDFYYPKSNKKVISKYLGTLIFDMRLFSALLFKKADYTAVMRVLFLPLTRLLFYMKGIIVISEFHADFKEEIPLLNKKPWEKKLLYVLSYFFNLNLKLSDGIIFNHPYLKNKFDPIFKKKSIYSYNGANFKDFRPLDMHECRAKLGILQEEFVFLFLGSVSQWHGVDYLIDIFNDASIAAKNNIRLYIVGGKKSAYVDGLVKKAVNKNIIFKDPVPSNIAELYINASNYCMLPVKHNRTSPGSPLKLYDYISCGKPVITQENMAGYSDEVLNYNLGFVIDFTKAEGAAKQILNIVETIDTDIFKNNNIDAAMNKTSWIERMKAWASFISDIQYK